MEIIAVSAVVGAVAFGLGIACGRSSPCIHDIKINDDYHSRKWVAEAQLDYERTLKKSLEQELDYIKRSCRLPHQPPFLGCDGCHHTTRYFAQTVEQQKLADMLARAKDTAKQLVKDLSV
jgi:hypothetical protein